jgi:hypothetical protein
MNTDLGKDSGDMTAKERREHGDFSFGSGGVVVVFHHERAKGENTKSNVAVEAGGF